MYHILFLLSYNVYFITVNYHFNTPSYVRSRAINKETQKFQIILSTFAYTVFTKTSEEFVNFC
jgi:hypothetical protein